MPGLGDDKRRMSVGEQATSHVQESVGLPADPAILDAMIQTHGASVARYAEARGAVDPEGVANEVFLKLFRRRDDLAFPNEVALRSYLFRTARNLVIDEARRQAARPAEVALDDARRCRRPGTSHRPSMMSC